MPRARCARAVLWLALALTLILTACLPPAPPPAPAAERGAPVPPGVRASLGQLPLYFVENRGQLDPRVGYTLLNGGVDTYFTAEGVTFALLGQTAEDRLKNEEAERASTGAGGEGHQVERAPRGAGDTLPPWPARTRWSVKVDFLGANPLAQTLGQDQQEAIASYFKGSPQQWITAIPTYASVAYRDLWPGIDLVYGGRGRQLKYTFVVRPGADPGQIALGYRGASEVRLNEQRQLEVATPVGLLVDDRPYAYQVGEGGQIQVAAEYTLDTSAAAETAVVRFRLGAYDSSRALVLDPTVLLYAGYTGGSGIDRAFGIAVDGAGNAYLTGITTSSQATFPVSVGPDVTFNGAADAFVAKVNAAGTGLVYAGYIGGSGEDRGTGIAVDGAGNAYVTGQTDSTEASFPVLVGPDLTFNGGLADAFVAKVNAAGTALVYAGYIGGSGEDGGTGIAVDGTGNAYVTGDTSSTQATFPVLAGPDLTFNGGPFDAFVAKVNAAGTAEVYAGYIGGSGEDRGTGIAVDGAGNAYVTGDTSSTQATFPVLVGPDLTFNGGLFDAFVAKVNAAGTALVYAGYIGGSDSDLGFGIAVDGTGNAYVTGQTVSTEASFPVSVGPDLTYNGANDAFVAKVNASGAALAYAGYIGGSSDDLGAGIAVDVAGNAYVTGRTSSTEATFPVLVGPDLTFNGGPTDAFVAKVNAAGTALVYAGYIGGGDDDFGHSIAVDGAGNAYVAGETLSTEATFPVLVGPDLTFNGATDAFVAKVGELPASIPALTAFVGGLGQLNEGQKNSLIVKLNAASASIASGNSKAACGQLGAFTDEVRALVQSKQLAAGPGDVLVTGAKAVQTSIGCG